MLTINIHKFISLVALCYCFICYFFSYSFLFFPPRPLSKLFFFHFIRLGLPISQWSVLQLIQARSIIKLNSIEFISMIWSMFLLDLTRGRPLLLLSKELLIYKLEFLIFDRRLGSSKHWGWKKILDNKSRCLSQLFPFSEAEMESVEIKITSLALSTYNLYPRVNSPSKRVYCHT